MAKKATTRKSFPIKDVHRTLDAAMERLKAEKHSAGKVKLLATLKIAKLALDCGDTMAPEL